MSSSNENQAPFFVRFLEGQEYPQVQTDVKAGPFGTTKYPSDGDEVHTMKYPSDGDENLPSA